MGGGGRSTKAWANTSVPCSRTQRWCHERESERRSSAHDNTVSVCFSLDCFILLLDHSVCWRDTVGVMGYTPHRARGIGCPDQGADRALKSRNTQYLLITLMCRGRTWTGPIKSRSKQVRFVGSGITLGDRASDLKADVE